ncbi:MAG: NAD(P)-dependent oxidoreductase [Kiritimatiellia bacterium]|nr:NAD(P)-dependent oxidoreductase [Kiritimatiellia bacterium]
MKILVTGNLGYIGSIMTFMLAKHGIEVWGYDAGYYQDCLLDKIEDNGVARQVYGDIRDITMEQIRGAEAVIHLAALSNDPTGELNPQLTHDINTVASQRLAVIAKQAGVSRFIFSSSCSIYGQSKAKALTEESPFYPQTAYARSKVDTEAALHELANDSFSPVYMRNATAYGYSSRLRFDLAVNNLTGWGFTTGQVKLLSDGRAWRPLVHVEDICQAFIQVLQAPREVVHDQAMNVGSESENYQIRDVANIVAEAIPHTAVTFAEGVSADSRTYNVDFSKIRKLLPSFEFEWNVAKGVRQLYEVFQKIGLTREQFEGRYFTRLKQLQYLEKEKRLDSHLRWIC